MQTWRLKQKSVPTANKPWGRRIACALLIVSTFAGAVYNFPFIWNRSAEFIQEKLGISISEVDPEDFHLGLDLQGGTHLTYEADMAQIPDDRRLSALEGVRDVIERRADAFGVAEPVVQTSTTGGSHRIIVELAGVLNVNEAIALIGETPVLEFKSPGQELDREPTQEELNALESANKLEREAAQKVLDRAKVGESFDSLVREFSIEKDASTRLGKIENITMDSYFMEYAAMIEERRISVGQVNGNLLENDDGISVFKYLDKSEQKQSLLSHILICYKGATGCESDMPEIEASIQIGKVREQATAENFAELAKQYSKDSSAQSGGNLGWASVDTFVAPFAAAASGLGVGEISDVVETEFGYHIVYKQDEKTVPVYTIQRVLMELSDIYDIIPSASPWVNTELSGKHLQSAAVEFDPNSGVPYVALSFNSEGGELFGKLTEQLVGQPIGIFLDGAAISTPVVQQAIYGGQAIITGNFTIEEAKLLAQRLNAGALPVPVNLLSQQTVGPTLGIISLEKSVNAGLIGFALIAIYMIAWYRVPGAIAIAALVLFAMINLATYKIFGVTITLASIAGFILSVGMAVDGNVLILERFKEEYASGRDFNSAVDEAFRRAWSAIRDGNLTTLIAAAVLYWFSSSFVKGFALTLAIGVALSMFTAITVSRVYIKSILGIKSMQKAHLFAVKR
jgi:protein-export membrane protein SecD